MDASNSFLSIPRYGYDFVVSTTQASINSGLLEYLNENTQPVTYLCFLVDTNTGNPTTTISLNDLLAQTGGINPFNIPDKTAYNDPRIQTLTAHRFVVGVKLRIGLPPGVLPKELPLIGELGNSANNVIFRMFCSDLQVIQNTPHTGWGGNGSWDVWSQPSGSPWYVETRADLVNEDLDKELNTPYFNAHADQKCQILAQLENLSSTEFSLQQLLLDMDNAVMQTLPTFQGVPAGSTAETTLQKSFISLYSTATKNYGEPLIAVTAVSQTIPDPSQLKMTAFERQVNVLKDGRDVPIQNPTPDQVAVTTLDHLCMVNNNAMPGAASFNWNWVLPQDANSESGIMAINRNIFSQYLLNTIMPIVERACITTKVEVTALDGVGDWTKHFDLFPGRTPQTAQVTEFSAGANVISIAYTSSGDASTVSEDQNASFFIELHIQPSYSCSVSFTGSTIIITQRLWVRVFVKYDAIIGDFNGYDKTITDVYNVSVNDRGNLNILPDPSKHQEQDNSQSPDSNWPTSLYKGVNDACNQLKSQLAPLITMDLNANTFNAPRNFVFPSAKVFTYASASFSKHQDLICDITYANPNQPILPPKPPNINVP